MSGKIARFFLVVFLCGLISQTVIPQEKMDQSQRIDRLERQILDQTSGHEGVFGVAAKHLETGEEVLVNGDVFFPFASVFKVPVFVEIMAQIMEGRFTLEEEISLVKSDQHLGSGMLSDLDVPGVTLSVRNLINLMMKISDNSATDILVEKVGPDNVNARLRRFGVMDMTVNRTCQELIMEAVGLNPEELRGLPLEEVVAVYRKKYRENPDEVNFAQENFPNVMKDQSTPRAMSDLLSLIFTKQILDEKSCRYIIDVMLKCQTGNNRIKGDLPRGVRVAHKTGTIGGMVNDVGIIYLPEDLGHVVLTVFSKKTELKTSEVEEVIAQISRFVYDYFYFTLDK